MLSQIWIGENVKFFKVLGSAHNQDVFCLQNVVLLPALQSTMSSDFFFRAKFIKIDWVSLAYQQVCKSCEFLLEPVTRNTHFWTIADVYTVVGNRCACIQRNERQALNRWMGIYKSVVNRCVDILGCKNTSRQSTRQWQLTEFQATLLCLSHYKLYFIQT